MNFDHRKHGFSLIELIIVISILGIVAAVAMPNMFLGNSQKLDVASTELADAIRFARAEAIRTGTPHGVWYFPFPTKLSVYRLVYVGGAAIPTYDVRHPVDKKLYSLDYSNNGNQAPVKIGVVTLNYGGSAINREYISFDDHGVPNYSNGETYQMLDNASIVLVYAGQSSMVSIAPMTGRVVVQ
ncbi:MAG: prepilin-type N-terminal cleavage/methylation domain-containing protein [Pseudomonadota bacterium]|nr:prepilin-type N-terminal cleavage/methylation domain-containing protein [Pseudomonadota bacterium]